MTAGVVLETQETEKESVCWACEKQKQTGSRNKTLFKQINPYFNL